MYLESIGNPRKFTRLARRTAAAKPLVVVQGARHAAAPGACRTGHPAAARHRVRAAAAGRGDPVEHDHRAGRRGASAGPPAAPPDPGWRSWQLGVPGAADVRRVPRRRTTTASSAGYHRGGLAEDFHRALTKALADDRCDAVVVTAIPAVGRRRPRTRPWQRPCDRPRPRPRRSRCSWCTSSSAASRRPCRRRPAPHTGGVHKPARARRPVPARTPGLRGQRPLGGEPRLIPALPRRGARRPRPRRGREVRPVAARGGRPRQGPQYEDIDEKGAAEQIDEVLSRGSGLTLAPEDACVLLGRYGIDVHRALPARRHRRGRGGRAHPWLPRGPQDHRTAPETPRRPGRRTPGSDGRGATRGRTRS